MSRTVVEEKYAEGKYFWQTETLLFLVHFADTVWDSVRGPVGTKMNKTPCFPPRREDKGTNS